VGKNRKVVAQNTIKTNARCRGRSVLIPVKKATLAKPVEWKLQRMKMRGNAGEQHR